MELVDEAERAVAQPRRAAASDSVASATPSTLTSPALGSVETAQQMQQRALARPGRADDGDALALRDVEVDAEQHRDVERAAAVGLAQVATGDDRRPGAGAGAHS